MTLNTQHAVTAANAAANAIAAQANAGFLDIYDGAQPAAGAAVTTQNKLARFTLSNPAFASAVNGVCAQNAWASVTILLSSGVGGVGPAAWSRLLKTDGTTILYDGSVGVGAGFNLSISNTLLVQNATLSISGYSYTFEIAVAGF